MTGSEKRTLVSGLRTVRHHIKLIESNLCFLMETSEEQDVALAIDIMESALLLSQLTNSLPQTNIVNEVCPFSEPYYREEETLYNEQISLDLTAVL